MEIKASNKRKKSNITWIFLKPVAFVFCISIVNGNLVAYYKKHFSSTFHSNQSAEKKSRQGLHETSYTNSKRLFDQNNYSNKENPNNNAYWRSRGYITRPGNWRELIEEEIAQTQDDLDNRSNQLNPNNDSYWKSRGYSERPDNWEHETSSSSNDEMDNHANQMNPNNEAYSSSRGGGKN